jgi:hypothetical protein
MVRASVEPPATRWGTLMLDRWLLSGFIALAMTATTIASAAAQPFTEVGAAGAIRHASALSGRIRSYHRGPGSWTGLTPPPADYCSTMREGEVVIKEIARLASRAILYRQPGLALRLQRAGDGLSDELDEEEEINQLSDIPYTIYPCPAPPGPYPARAVVLRLVEQRMPACREEADALHVSFGARRSFMQQCLRS